MMMKVEMEPSEFINLKGIEYFKFEEDFMEENIRCIPMAIRFKMDLAGIKLKLGEWGRFKPAERVKLALLPVTNSPDIEKFRSYLTALIIKYTGKTGTPLAIETHPAWQNRAQIPQILKEKSAEIQLHIPLYQWQKLTNIQRFALLKLCRPGHENENFPKAVAEFGLIKA